MAFLSLSIWHDGQLMKPTDSWSNCDQRKNISVLLKHISLVLSPPMALVCLYKSSECGDKDASERKVETI